MSESKVREQKRDKPGKRGEGWTEKIADLIRAQALGGVVACFVLGVSAVLVYGGIVSYTKADSMIVASCLLGSFVSGLLVGKTAKRPNVLLGLGAGGGLLLILFALGAILYDGMPDTASLWLVGGSCLCGGGLSGFFGRKQTKARRR